MSGTSADGVDAALVEIDQQNLKLIGAVNCAYPASVREKILQLNIDPVLDIADLCELEHQVSISFIEATQTLLNKHSVDCLLYTSPSPRDATLSRMPSSA